MTNKVVIVGAGQVGAAFAYALAQQGLAAEIVLIDANRELAQGQALDLAHGQAYFPTVSIRVGNVADYSDAAVIVITAGASQKPGETRLDLLNRNATIMRSICCDIRAQNPPGIVVVVSNPCDVLTRLAKSTLGLPSERVIGSGTVLDSARLRYFVSQHCAVDIHSTHAFILGEHGESEFAAWSLVNIGGIPIRTYCQSQRCSQDPSIVFDQLERSVRESAYHIIDYKGSTAFGVGMALVRIVGAILRDSKSVLTISTDPQGSYGIKDCSLSIPCVIGANGVEKILPAPLDPREIGALNHSAEILTRAFEEMTHANTR